MAGMIRVRIVGMLTGVVLLVMTGCSESSDAGAQTMVPECGDAIDTIACVAEIGDLDPDVAAMLDGLDDDLPDTIEAGACTGGGTSSGRYWLCVIPIDDGQVVVGSDDSDEGLILRTEINSELVEFLVDNAAGWVTVLGGQSSSFDIVRPDGPTVAVFSGPALTEPAS